MATNPTQDPDFIFYAWNPNKPTSIKVTPKMKDFSLASSASGSFLIRFLNATQFDLEITFPEPLHATPNPLYISAGQVGSVTVVPGQLGDFVCYVRLLGCPTCSTRLLRTSTVSARADGEGDEDPIIKIKP